MNTIRTIIIILLLTGVNKLNSQSDATLEETVLWLNTYVEDYLSANEDTSGKILDFYISQSDDNIKFKYSLQHEFEGKFSKELDVKQITFMSLGQNSTSKRYYLTFRSNEIDGFIFHTTTNMKNAQSAFNAFKHYFTLLGLKVEFEDKISIKNKF